MVHRALVAGALVVAVAAGCAQPGAADHEDHTPVPARAAAPRATGLNGTDAAWLQLMIPMDEQTLQLLDLVPARTANPATRRLVTLVGAGLRTEVDQLRALRTRSGVSTTNVHAGHDLPGLVTADELAAAGKARGAALDRLVVTQLREQFDQSMLLCRGERGSGADAATKTLAASIERTRTVQLTQLPAA
jgi:hypothetical protein